MTTKKTYTHLPINIDLDFTSIGTVNYEHKIWNISLILINYLATLNRTCTIESDPQSKVSWSPSPFKGKWVLELGAGLGHLGFALRCLGATVVVTEIDKEMAILKETISDLEQDCSELDRIFHEIRSIRKDAVVGASENDPVSVPKVVNFCAEKDANGGSIVAEELFWGEKGLHQSNILSYLKGQTHFDYILMADLVYDEILYDDLFWTLNELCGPNTVIYNAFMTRTFTLNFLVQMHDRGIFKTEMINDVEHFGFGDDGEKVFMVTHKKKPSSS